MASSHPHGTICIVTPLWRHLGVLPWAKKNKRDEPAVSETGIALTRSVAFKFALDLTVEQSRQLFMCAGHGALPITTTSGG